MNETTEAPFYQRLSLTLLALVIIAFAIHVGQDIIVPLAFAILFFHLVIACC